MSVRFGWLKCAVSEGMFPSEYAVECTATDRKTVSFFAPQSLVNKEKGQVKVRELERKDDYCLVFLPATPLEDDATRAIKVSKSLIEAV